MKTHFFETSSYNFWLLIWTMYRNLAIIINNKIGQIMAIESLKTTYGIYIH
jgi:hypothetical protein